MNIGALTELEQMELGQMLTRKLNLYTEVLTLVEEMKIAKTEADFGFIQDEIEHNEARMGENEDAIIDFLDDNKHKYEDNLGKA